MTFSEISEIHTLEELCLSIQDGDWIETKDQSSDGYRLLQIGNIAVGKFRESGKPRYVSEDTFRRLNCTKIQIGDVLIARMPEPTGRAWCVDSPIPDSITSVDVAIVRVNPTKLDAKYLSYFLNQKTTFQLIASLQTGSTRQRIKRSELAALEIRTHSLDIQRAIANILSTLDKKIAANDAVSETLEVIAQTIFKSWFIDFDPVKAKMAGEKPEGMDDATAALFPDSMEESELGLIPEGWNISKLRNHLEVTKGKSYKSSELEESDTALVTLKSFKRGGGYRFDGLKPFSGEFKPEQVVEPGELIVSFTDVTQAADIIGKPAIVFKNPSFSRLVASLDVGIVRPLGNEVGKHYLYQLFSTPGFKNHIDGYTNGTTVLHLGKGALEDFAVALPGSKMMSKYEMFASTALSQLQALYLENLTLEAIRDSLLPRLISGELQIPDEMLAS